MVELALTLFWLAITGLILAAWWAYRVNRNG